MTLKAISNETPGIFVTHEVPVPPLCPVTGNPVSAHLIIQYKPDKTIIDVLTITPYLATFIGSTVYRDLEKFSRAVYDDVRQLINVDVCVKAQYELTDGQKLITVDGKFDIFDT